MKLIKSKKGIYNWFVLVVTVILLITVFISLYVQKSSMDFNTLGKRSALIYDAAAKQELRQIIFEEASKRASNQVIIDMLLNSGFGSVVQDNSYTPRVNYKFEKIRKEFWNGFILKMKEEMKSEHINYVLAENTVQTFDDGSGVYGFGEYVEKTTTSEYGELNLSYIPSFSFKFENYNLQEYEYVYETMGAVYEFMGQCGNEKTKKNVVKDNYNMFVCILEKLAIKEANDAQFNFIASRFNFKFDENCLKTFDDEYFKEFQRKWQNRVSNEEYKDIRFICLEDSNRYIAGHKYQDGKDKFIVRNPIYVFKINKTKAMQDQGFVMDDGANQNMNSDENSIVDKNDIFYNIGEIGNTLQ